MKKSTASAASQSIEVIGSGAEVIGIDLGDRVSHYVGLDQKGEVVASGRVPTTAAAIEKRFGSIGAKLMAIETGTHSPWVSRLLTRLGHRVIVANSRKLRLIYENQNKNDRADAEYLARLARMDPKLLEPIAHRSEREQQHVAVLRSRDVLVRTRSRLITHVRGTIKSMGLRVPACSAEAFVKRAKPIVPPELKAALGPVLKMIEQLHKQIASYDRRIEGLSKDAYRAAQLLTHLNAGGALTAAAIAVPPGVADAVARTRPLGAWP